MDLALDEFARSIALGATLIAGASIALLPVSKHVRRFWEAIQEKPTISVLMLPALLVLGMLAEGVSKELARSSELIHCIGIDNEEELRTSLLFERDRNDQWVPTSFGKDLLNVELFQEFRNDDIKGLQKRTVAFSDVLLERKVNLFFYHAKAIVFRDRQYYTELDSLEDRVHFARGFAFIAIVVASLASLFVLATVTALAIIAVATRTNAGVFVHFFAAKHLDCVNSEFRKICLHSSALALASIVLFGFASYAYKAECKSYHGRVYGYAIEMLDKTLEPKVEGAVKP